jgi:hypothetical protein
LLDLLGCFTEGFERLADAERGEHDGGLGFRSLHRQRGVRYLGQQKSDVR